MDNKIEKLIEAMNASIESAQKELNQIEQRAELLMEQDQGEDEPRYVNELYIDARLKLIHAEQLKDWVMAVIA